MSHRIHRRGSRDISSTSCPVISYQKPFLSHLHFLTFPVIFISLSPSPVSPGQWLLGMCQDHVIPHPRRPLSPSFSPSGTVPLFDLCFKKIPGKAGVGLEKQTRLKLQNQTEQGTKSNPGVRHPAGQRSTQSTCSRGCGQFFTIKVRYILKTTQSLFLEMLVY